jgi:hypothetical protein
MVTAADVWEVELVAGGRPTGPGRRALPVADQVVELTVQESWPVRARTALARLRRRVLVRRSR